MNAQEIFDKVVFHLRTQNAKSMVGGNCVYRGEQNMKCAVGCLIPDEEYRPEFESKNFCGVIGWINMYDVKCPHTSALSEHDRMLMLLQAAHDNARVEQWEDRFQEVATIYSLKYQRPLPSQLPDNEEED